MIFDGLPILSGGGFNQFIPLEKPTITSSQRITHTNSYTGKGICYLGANRFIASSSTSNNRGVDTVNVIIDGTSYEIIKPVGVSSSNPTAYANSGDSAWGKDFVTFHSSSTGTLYCFVFPFNTSLEITTVTYVGSSYISNKDDYTPAGFVLLL